MPLSTGSVLINRYRIVKLLGQGGFGAVYKAWDLNLKCPCALKENLGTDTEAQEQFQREATILAHLTHPGLVRVTDYFTIPGKGQYLVMDYIQGEDLQAMLDASHTIPEDKALDWVGQVCDVLTYLHKQNPAVIHRDIKPANIKINPEGRAILVDFGIAKMYDPNRKTTVGARAVTPSYSPPEQYGKGKTDGRTDIYALGATLYAILTGREPVDAMARSTGTPLPAPRQVNPSISHPVEQAIMRAMALVPDQRLQNAAEFKAAILKKGASRPRPVVTPPMPAAQPAQAGQPFKSPAPHAAQAPQPVPQVYAPQPMQAYPPAVYPPVAPQAYPAAPPPASKKFSPWAIVGLAAAGLLVCGTLGLVAGLAIFTPRRAAPTPRLVAVSTPTSGYTAPTSMVNPTSLPPTGMPNPTAAPSVTPWFTSTPSVAGTWQACSDSYYFSRLHVGDNASVSTYPNLPNNVRDGPGTYYTKIGQIMPGERLVILEGPGCAQNWVWWRIRSKTSGLEGWTAEGDGTNYWLVPEP